MLKDTLNPFHKVSNTIMSGQINDREILVLANGDMIILGKDRHGRSYDMPYDAHLTDKLYFTPNSSRRWQRGILLGGVTLYGQQNVHNIDTLSSSKWKLHGRRTINVITRALTEVLELLQQEKQKNGKVDADTTSILRELFNELDDSKKTEFRCKYKNSKFNSALSDNCPVCNNFYDGEDDKKSCIHTNCDKMCGNCYNTWEKKNVCESKEGGNDENCPSCKQEQIIQCPICLDAIGKDDILKSETCDHYVCFKCYGMACHKKKPITTCPLCRSKFSS